MAREYQSKLKMKEELRLQLFSYRNRLRKQGSKLKKMPKLRELNMLKPTLTFQKFQLLRQSNQF
jgi:hypothetical protein